MSLQAADWHDTLSVLHETVHIWSAGLSTTDYHYFLSCQQETPWFRQHCRFLVNKVQGKVKASCKLYTLEYAFRGRTLRIAGLGAVYTQKEFRNRGCASELVNDIIDLCEEENFDAIVLYSEINPEFYEAFGFEEFGCVDFTLELAEPGLLLEGLSLDAYVETGRLTAKDIPLLSKHYSRWLRAQPFGVARNPAYWHYKIFKEHFLHERSRTDWPELQLLKVDLARAGFAYAIAETRGIDLRILEIVGSAPARKTLWTHLLMQVAHGNVKSLGGWEAVIRDLAPTYKVRSLNLENVHGLDELITVYCSKRQWGQGMILCLDQELRSWLNVNPCPMLELDHL